LNTADTSSHCANKSPCNELSCLAPIKEASYADSLIGKRKRKSERDLSLLKDELKKDLMWTREKITELSKRLTMSETQVYKWWWDQTRKRVKKLSKKDASKKKGTRIQLTLESLPDKELIIPSTDEFGGYSSRLRLSDNSSASTPEIHHDDQMFEQNLCALLGIDIEAKALEIVRRDQLAASPQ
jgi:hypothetical protein